MRCTALSMAVPIDGENHQFNVQVPLMGREIRHEVE